MKQNLMMMALAVMSAATLGAPPLPAAESSQELAQALGAPLPPRVDVVPVPVSRLHLGMTASEVTRIMGNAAKTESTVVGGIEMRSLDFTAGSIPSRITLTNGKVSRVALDVFRVDKDDLPGFSRRAWPGMISGAVLRILGTPVDVRHYMFFGIKLDQLVFQRSGQPEVSVFFVADRVVAKTLGRGIPPDVFHVNLPSSAESVSEDEIPFAQAGMTTGDVQALYGAVKLRVDYTFNGRPASHVIHETRDGHSFASFTFVDGIVTEFEDIGHLPEDEIFQGR